MIIEIFKTKGVSKVAATATAMTMTVAKGVAMEVLYCNIPRSNRAVGDALATNLEMA